MQRHEVTIALGHLIGVEEQMSVASHGKGVFLRTPDSGVVVQAEGEMVLDEVLARDAQVERIPERELVFHALYSVCGDCTVSRDWRVQEDRVPHRLNQRVRFQN